VSEPSVEKPNRQRLGYLFAAIITIVIGIVSRVVQTEILIFDKYLGDALYAVLIYLIFRITFPWHPIHIHAIIAIVLAIAIELFQITGVPASMRVSDNPVLKLASIVLGTKFAILDIVAYAIGVLIAWLTDVWSIKNRKPDSSS